MAATKIGIVGLPNTGKSYGRKFLTNPEEAFIIMPSKKITYLEKDGKQLPKLEIKTDKCADLPALLKALNISSASTFFNSVVDSPILSKLVITGNHHVVDSIQEAEALMKFINVAMPHIKVIIVADFTHYISKVVASQDFMMQNTGGMAFSRLN